MHANVCANVCTGPIPSTSRLQHKSKQKAMHREEGAQGVMKQWVNHFQGKGGHIPAVLGPLLSRNTETCRKKV